MKAAIPFVTPRPQACTYDEPSAPPRQEKETGLSVALREAASGKNLSIREAFDVFAVEKNGSLHMIETWAALYHLGLKGSTADQVVRFFDLMAEAKIGRVGFRKLHNFVEAAEEERAALDSAPTGGRPPALSPTASPLGPLAGSGTFHLRELGSAPLQGAPPHHPSLTRHTTPTVPEERTSLPPDLARLTPATAPPPRPPGPLPLLRLSSCQGEFTPLLLLPRTDESVWGEPGGRLVVLHDGQVALRAEGEEDFRERAQRAKEEKEAREEQTSRGSSRVRKPEEPQAAETPKSEEEAKEGPKAVEAARPHERLPSVGTWYTLLLPQEEAPSKEEKKEGPHSEEEKKDQEEERPYSFRRPSLGCPVNDKEQKGAPRSAHVCKAQVAKPGRWNVCTLVEKLGTPEDRRATAYLNGEVVFHLTEHVALEGSLAIDTSAGRCLLGSAPEVHTAAAVAAALVSKTCLEASSECNA